MDAAPGEAVFEVAAPQVFDVHARRHPRCVRQPGSERIDRGGLALEVARDQPGPEHVVGPQGVEGGGHLPAFEDALRRHQRFESVHVGRRQELAVVAGVFKIRLRREQTYGCKSIFAIPALPGGLERQQGAAKAVTHRVRACAADRADEVQGGRHPLAPIVVEREVAVLWPRVAPRNGEHRKTGLHQMPDQRRLGREVQDVELHDPGGHEQHRLGPDLCRRRIVLDELHEAIAVDDLPAGGGEVLAHRQRIFPAERPAGGGTREIARQKRRAFEQAPAAGPGRRGQDLRVGGRPVARGERAEAEPAQHLQTAAIRLGEARQRAAGGAPQLLCEELGLSQIGVRRQIPTLAREALVVPVRLDRPVRTRRARGGERRQPAAEVCSKRRQPFRMTDELVRPACRRREVRGGIETRGGAGERLAHEDVGAGRIGNGRRLAGRQGRRIESQGSPPFAGAKWFRRRTDQGAGLCGRTP